MEKNYSKSAKIRKILSNRLSAIGCMITMLFGSLTGISQANYTNVVLSESHVTSSAHSIDANPATYSELEAGTGLIIGIGSYSSHIDLEFPTALPANQTSFVRIETQDNILSSLLGGTLGNLLSGVVGVALTGNQEFSVEVKNGASTVLSGNSANPASFAGERLKVVLDVNGHTYLAITPNQSYKSIRITNYTGSLVGLGVKKRMKVWDPYYVTQGANCAMPQFTSYDAAGITLELLNLGGGVHDLERAIDGNLSSFSILSLGVVSVTSNITQRIYFEGVSQPTDVFAVRLGIDPALLAITLGQGIRLRTQNGANVITNSTLQSLLTPADIAALQNNQPVTIFLAPNAGIDRVILELNGILGVTVSQSLDLFEVYKIASPPISTISGPGTIICAGTSATLVGNAVNPSDEIRWYTDTITTTPIGITASGAPYTTGILTSDTVFYMASAIPGCPNESMRIPLFVDVIPGPDPSAISVPVLPEYCAIDSVTLVANSSLGTAFEWYLDLNATSPIVSGQQNGTHTYSVNNDSITISGLSPADSPFTIYVSVQDTITGCWSLPGEYASITITIIDELPPTATQLEQTFCANEWATVADLQVNGGTINWYDAPVGGNLLSATTLLQDSVNYYASSVGAVCESSSRLEILAVINDEPAPTTTDLHQYFCVSDNATLNDLIITGTSINWYDENGTSLPFTTTLTNGGIYIATNQGALCESSDSLTIIVSVSDLPAPTTSNATQTFCEANNPTIDDIVLNETTVSWYDASGNSVAPGTLLTDSTSYYATLVSPTCQSSDSLEVTVVFETVPAPTAEDTTQIFCGPGYTVADIDVNESNIVWYDAPTGGNVVNPSTALIDGTTYYASQQGMVCESDTRLEVTVEIENVPAPTTTNAVQSFCTSVTPTIGDLQVNEPNVAWYNENGVLLNNSSELQDGETYYAVLLQGICQSSDSLAVSVIIEDQYITSLTGDTSDVCSSDTLVYSIPSGMSNYQWSITGGSVISGGGTSDNTITVAWENTSVTTIEVSYETPNGCLVQTQQAITVTVISCSDLMIAKTVNNLHPFIGEEIVFTITVSNTGADNFSNIVVNEVIQSGFSFIGYQATNGTYNSTTGEWVIPNLAGNETAVLTITVSVNPNGNYTNVATITSGDDDDVDPDNNSSEVVVEPHCLTVYNEISPNGDGVNDVLYVDCIEQFPANSIVIYNRYGNIVYSVESYKNDWNGMANVGGVLGKGEPLPAGTYYYLLKIEQEEFESSGWIYIVR